MGNDGSNCSLVISFSFSELLFMMRCLLLTFTDNPLGSGSLQLKPSGRKHNGVIEIICIFQLYRSVAFLNVTPHTLSQTFNHS